MTDDRPGTVNVQVRGHIRRHGMTGRYAYGGCSTPPSRTVVMSRDIVHGCLAPMPCRRDNYDANRTTPGSPPIWSPIAEQVSWTAAQRFAQRTKGGEPNGPGATVLQD